MINVLLVDDDYLVRMYLRQLITWEKEGYALVGDVCNGEEALAVLAEIPVQIVITDISMPVMDGVAFIQRVKEIGSSVQVAVLSCHDEFEYVKEAMRLGATEYVLKNELDAESLRRLLKSLRQNVEQSVRQQNRETELWQLAQKGREQLKQEALEVMMSEELPYAKQSELLREHKWTGNFSCAGVVAFDAARQEKKEIFVQVCKQLIRDMPVEYVMDVDGITYLIADISGLTAQTDGGTYLRSLAEQLAQAFKQYAGTTPSIAVSGVYASDGGVTKALRQANQLLRHGFYGERMIFPDTEPPMHSELPAEAQELQRCFSEIGDDTTYKSLLFQKALNVIGELRVEPAQVTGWIVKMDQACTPECCEKVLDIDDCAGRLDLYKAFWNRLDSLPESGVENLAVKEAVVYIRQNFTQQITLQTVADAVYRNPAYLSHVFKREVGRSFTEYLHTLRIERVKQLLDSHGGSSIKQAALAAGFCDYRHFSKIFKKETGINPADWKRLKK